MTAVPIRRRLIHGSFEVLLAEGLGVPAGILAAAYLTRQLGPQGYGLFALAASLLTSLEWILHSMLSRASVKASAESDNWRGTAAALVRRYLAIAITLAVACWLGAGLIAAWLDVPALASLIRLSTVQLPIVALSGALLSTLVGRGFYRARAGARAARWLSRLTFIVLFVGAADMGVRGAVLAGVCAPLASALVGLAILRVNPFEPPAALSGFWRLALAVFTTAASVRLLEKMGLMLMKAFGGTVEGAGFYAAAQNFTLGPGLFAISVAPLLLGSLAQAHRDGNQPLAQLLCRDALRGIMWLLPIAGIGAGAAPELVALVYGPRFLDAAPLAQYLAFAGVAIAGLSITGAILAAHDRADLSVAATVPVLPLAVVGYFFVVPVWGALGAAATTTLVTSLGFAASLVAIARRLGVMTPPATLVRAVLVTVVCWVVAAAWPTPGILVIVKGAVLMGLALALMALSGEITPGEINLLRTLNPWGRSDTGHRLDRPPAGYLDAFLADQKRRENLALVEQWADLPAAGRVLKTDLFDESRPGEGFLDAVAAPGRLLVGIDLSAGIARASVERLTDAGVHGVVADVRRVPFVSGAFDLVVSNSTLDHFDATSDIDRALAEIARVVRPGGTVIVTLDNPHNLTYPLLRAASAIGATPFPLGETYSASRLCAALERAGLEVTDTRAIIHNPRLLPTAGVLVSERLQWPALARAVHHLQRRFERFEGTRWQYLTGCFVAARAVKPATRG
jgi:O-antigen/teichoic acid export membrane protein/SAM-dependent methyltransferase